jgi:hypothetical protein
MMRKTLVVLLAGVAVLTTPVSASAWGFAAHRFIMRQAVDILPAELKPFFVAHRDELVIRVVDPDLWRNVGWEDDPNHFMDFGVEEYGSYPFTALPRDYSAAVEKFGIAVVKRNGTLPWRLEEMFGNLRRSFEAFRRSSPYTVSDTILFSAVASHYLQDAFQPFHATNNFDGQLTRQHGLHARFERDLFERFEPRITVRPGSILPIQDPRKAAFDTLLSSYQLVDPILKADRDAAAGKTTYDDQYFGRFFMSAQPLLEKRLSEAITATASLLVGAWQQAGRPTLRMGDVRPIQTVRPAQ